MKNLIILITICSFLICKAQQTIVDVSNKIDWTTNTYLKDTNNHFNDVLGTWKWEAGNTFFEITFVKLTQFQYPNINMSADFMLGKYKYVLNGSEIANTLNANDDSPLRFYATLIFHSTNKYGIILKDVVSNKVMKGLFILSNSNSTATYSLENTQGMKVYQSNLDFSLPTSLTLTKQ
jgi:hypothetical protein